MKITPKDLARDPLTVPVAERDYDWATQRRFGAAEVGGSAASTVTLTSTITKGIMGHTDHDSRPDSD